MSGFSEDDIRRAADVREWLMKQISDKQEEVERLRTTLSIIDSLLKQGSFRAAASIGFAAAGAPAAATTTAQMQQARQAPTPPAPPARQQASQPTLKAGDKDIRPLKRAKDDMTLANVEVTPNAAVIVPASGVALSANTPPFKSFFLSRILDGMKAKDAEKVSQGALKEGDAVSYKVEEDSGGQIRRIVISNYRDKDRLQEIFNTSAWVFTRMLEKSGS